MPGEVDVAPPGPPGGEPEGDCAQQFMALLASEHRAAVNLDVESLAALQPRKRSLLGELRRDAAPAAEMDALRRAAQLNVTLIRQLVQGLGGLVGVERPQTYNALGRSEAPPSVLLKGAV